jgi:hypothetical protein
MRYFVLSNPRACAAFALMGAACLIGPATIAQDGSFKPERTVPRARADLIYSYSEIVKKAAPAQLKDVVLKAQPGSVNVVSAGGGHTIVLLVAREPAGQRDLGTPGVRDGIRELLQERRTQLLRLAYITTARNGADIVNNLARQIVQAQAPPPGMTPAAPGGE